MQNSWIMETEECPTLNTKACCWTYSWTHSLPHNVSPRTTLLLSGRLELAPLQEASSFKYFVHFLFPHLSHFPTWLSRSYSTNRISFLLYSTFNQNPVGDPFKTEFWLLYDTFPFSSMCILYVLKLLDIHLQISEWKKSVALTSS
jgi:hypothetical protein